MPPATEHVNRQRRTAIRRRLLQWYRREHRRLPWRQQPAPRGKQPVHPDPYHVLVSEVMLQQTQVVTVIDYFHRFIEAFPTIDALAGAAEQEVLRLWQGLGYYRRARLLHRAAKVIVNEHGGEFPTTAEELLMLPGIGRYAAGAIASIAFTRREPVVDGNVKRVLARLEAIDQPIDKPRVETRLWSIAGELVPPSTPGDFNQALMELGATICSARSPRCLVCPLREVCRARECGIAEQLPVRSRETKQQPVDHHILAIKRGGRYLFQQRPETGLWSNMWQLPTVEQLDSDDVSWTLMQWTESTLGLRVQRIEERNRFRHQTTHRAITFHVWIAEGVTGRLRRGAGVWRALDDLEDLPLANPQRKAIALLDAG